MSTFTEQAQENVMFEHQGKYGGIVGKQRPSFDSNSETYKHYERCILYKSPDVTFLTFRIFQWDPQKNAMKKCGMVTMRNPYQIYNFKHHHFKKYDKVDETVSIDATKNDEVPIDNKQY